MPDTFTWTDAADRALDAQTTADDAWALEQERRTEAGLCLDCRDGWRYDYRLGIIPCTSCDGSGVALPLS